MTMVPFSHSSAVPIFLHLLVLTYEKNIGFVELFPGKALEAKLFASFHVFLATAAAC